MRSYITYILMVMLVACVAFAGKTSTISMRQVRDPIQLQSWLDAAPTALSVTNGEPVTVAASTYIVSGVGQANNYTNTITLSAPSAAGQMLTLIVATASSNLVTIADSTTVAASGAILLDGNDTAVLRAVDTSTWCLISESDN